MSKQNDPNKIFSILRDHEKRIAALEGKNTNKRKQKTDSWYKPGSTADKIVALIEEGFFDHPHSISETISELSTRDYHFKSSDLTLPLRNIVRKGLLKRTKINADGSVSNHWLFAKV